MDATALNGILGVQLTLSLHIKIRVSLGVLGPHHDFCYVEITNERIGAPDEECLVPTSMTGQND